MFDNMSDKNKRKFLDRFLYTLYLHHPCQKYETLDYGTKYKKYENTLTVVILEQKMNDIE